MSPKTLKHRDRATEAWWASPWRKHNRGVRMSSSLEKEFFSLGMLAWSQAPQEASVYYGENWEAETEVIK